MNMNSYTFYCRAYIEIQMFPTNAKENVSFAIMFMLKACRYIGRPTSFITIIVCPLQT